MKLSAMKIDAARAEEGAWVDNIPEAGDLRLRVRDPRNADARRLRAKLVDAVPRAKRLNGRLDPDEADRIESRIFAEAILVDWDGLTDDDGTAMPYNRAKAVELLSDPNMRPFRDAVAWASSTVAEDAAEQLKADVGN